MSRSSNGISLSNDYSIVRNSTESVHNSDLHDKGVDRISELPDSIILHILSFLPIEDAVKTGFLSKQFSYLWTDLDALEFVDSNLKFINNTLFFHNRSNLKKFSIICRDDYTDFAFKFDRWIRVLFRSCPVKDLTLKFTLFDYKLPQFFYSNSSLIKLNLLGCEISMTGSVKWESLQSLTISYTSLSNLNISDILSGCPCIEFLEFSNCNGFTKIWLINNKCLKKLVIRDYEEELGTLEIFAPHLESFVLSGDIDTVKCKVFSANCLIDCCLDFRLVSGNDREDKAIHMLTYLLEDLRLVKDVITIGEWGLQVLSLIERKGLPFPLSKSKFRCLKLDTKLTTVVIAGIKCLLRSLKCLEKLYITKCEYDKKWLGNEKWCLRSEDLEIDFDLKLKSVEICGFKPWGGYCHEVDFYVSLFLKKARFLEKVTLVLPFKLTHYESSLEDLLSLPRCSPRAVFRILNWVYFDKL